MKTLVCTRPGEFEYSTGERPESTPGQAIIKIKRIGICGTDLHAFEGTQPYFEYPRILGHELSCELVAVDGAEGFEVGETVTFIPYFYCGKCVACRTGKEKYYGVGFCGSIAGATTEYRGPRFELLTTDPPRPVYDSLHILNDHPKHVAQHLRPTTGSSEFSTIVSLPLEAHPRRLSHQPYDHPSTYRTRC